MVHVHNKPCTESSTSSIDQDVVQESEEKKVQDFAKQMLQGRLFIGIFQEKRHVVNLNAYRDVVMVSRDENELICDLKAVRKRIQNYYTFDHWIGITTPEVIGAPAGYCIWVELDNEVFGSYWYKIRTVKFRKDEILLRVKALRRVDNPEESHPDGTLKNNEASRENILTKQDFDSIKMIFVKYLTNFFSTVLSWHNTKEAIVFLSVLLATIATGSVQIFKYLAEYFLKLMHETSNFINVSTPIIIAFINLLAKMIGGLYLLIATLWRDRNVSGVQIYEPQHVNRRPMISYYGYETRPNPQRRATSSVVITPLD